MGLFGFSRRPVIDEGLKAYAADPGALLLDVRSAQEYRDGHIPGSQNLPLRSIDEIVSIAEQKDRPLYVYCHSGVRSQQVVNALQELGYSNVKNIGGIASYAGKIEF